MRKLSLHSLLVAAFGLILVLLVIVLLAFGGKGNDATSQAEKVVAPANSRPVASNAGVSGLDANNIPSANGQPRLTIGQSSAPEPGVIGDEYLALGDSVAYGLGAPNPNEGGYAGLFYRNYLKPFSPNPKTYTNIAAPGETSTSFFTAKSGQSQFAKALAILQTAAGSNRLVSPISVSLGGNDLLDARGKSETDKQAALSQYESNLAHLLDELKKASPRSEIIVATYYNPYAASSNNNKQAEDAETAWVKRFNASIGRIGGEKGARVADFFSQIAGRETNLTWIGSGDVHPNTRGYTQLAQEMWRASGYDRQGPKLELIYRSLAANQKVSAGTRYSFKVRAQDELAGVATGDVTANSAGGVVAARSTLDDGPKVALAVVPTRYVIDKNGAEYTYILDSSSLAPGRHTLTFDATDSAGNVSSLQLDFEVVG